MERNAIRQALIEHVNNLSDLGRKMAEATPRMAAAYVDWLAKAGQKMSAPLKK